MMPMLGGYTRGVIMVRVESSFIKTSAAPSGMVEINSGPMTRTRSQCVVDDFRSRSRSERLLIEGSTRCLRSDAHTSLAP